MTGASFIAVSRFRTSLGQPSARSPSPSSKPIISSRGSVFIPEARRHDAALTQLSPGKNIKRPRCSISPSLSDEEEAKRQKKAELLSKQLAKVPKLQDRDRAKAAIARNLLQQLVPCQYLTHQGTIRVNDIAGEYGPLSGREFDIGAWETERPVTQQIAFLDHVQESPSVEISPQHRRILLNETDNREAFGANVLAILPEIVRLFLDVKYQEKFEIQLFCEHATNVPWKQDPKTKYRRVRIDYFFMLVVRQEDVCELEKLDFQIPLLGIEVKRHDFVKSNEWVDEEPGRVQLEELHENVQKLLPQVLLYADVFHCKRILLTDYSDSIMCDIGFADISERVRGELVAKEAPIPLAYRPITGRSAPWAPDVKDIYHYGPRLALAFELYGALKDLGLLRIKAYSDPKERILDERIKKFLPPPPLPKRPRADSGVDVSVRNRHH